MDYKDIKFPNNTKFLVTGGAGFIGSNLVETLLEKNCYVRVLDNFSNGKEENIEEFKDNINFELIEGDIRDIDTCMIACKDIDYVLHQAAWGSVPKSIEFPLIYEEINIKGTVNMMQAARYNKVKTFVYASSSSVYGDSVNLPKKEGEEGSVLSPYALTKSVDEKYGMLFHNLYGLNTIGLRYFNVFGKKQDPNGNYAAVIPKFINLLTQNEAPTINGDGMQSRDFTYIDNVIEANLKACVTKSQEAFGQSYNVAYGERIFLIDLYKILCEALNVKINPIYRENRKGDIRDSYADISKAQKLLNYEPLCSFENGLHKTIEWYLKNL